MNIFDILGPIMVGPSSSHTAGAVRMGLMARKLLGKPPIRAEIILYGSFADTGVGHGTDKALIAGLLGMQPDDNNIVRSEEIAKEKGLIVSFERGTLEGAHPNTAVIVAKADDGSQVTMRASSQGGGRILVECIDDIVVSISGEHDTLIIYNEDRPGYVANVARVLADYNANIGTMRLCRDKRGGDAVMVIEIDDPVPIEKIQKIEELEGIHKVRYVKNLYV